MFPSLKLSQRAANCIYVVVLKREAIPVTDRRGP
jgi:hypothetical protein